MKIHTAFPSDYLRATDLQDHTVTVVIERIEMREIGGDPKPVLYFEGKERGLVLNKTNSNTIAAIYGDETDDWIGQPIALFEAQVDYQGRQVPAIRVRIPPRKPANGAPRTPANAATHQEREITPPPFNHPAERGVDDTIPF